MTSSIKAACPAASHARKVWNHRASAPTVTDVDAPLSKHNPKQIPRDLILLVRCRTEQGAVKRMFLKHPSISFPIAWHSHQVVTGKDSGNGIHSESPAINGHAKKLGVGAFGGCLLPTALDAEFATRPGPN